MTAERYDALILGAGMSGLAAGIRLALFGKRVAILERHELWGGLNSFYSLGGRRFDVGLHALTNYAAPGERGRPLTKLLRQLRLKHADLELGEQRESEILFPGVRLAFSNDVERLTAEVAREFPAAVDRFGQLVRDVEAADPATFGAGASGARALLHERLGDPLLAEMLLTPLAFYGSAREDDVDTDLFVILFRSLFLEGLAYPAGGIRTLLNLLVKRYKHAGGELRMRCGAREILVRGGEAIGVVTDDGTELLAERVLSSAGRVETARLVGQEAPASQRGRLSFLESISVLDRRPAELGHTAATSFFCDSARLAYRAPDELVDVRSGVISAPTNYVGGDALPEGLMRLTVLANPARWPDLPPDEYAAAKEACADAAIESVARFVPDWRAHTVFRDVFTPRTIRHFTGHENGAVYGSPEKARTGETDVRNLFLIGTDQGLVGVVGALLSGITMANRHVLAGAGSVSA